MQTWKSSISLALLLVLVAALGGSVGNGGTARAATTRVWTGAVNLTWSTPGNWDPAGPPVDGDSVVIGASAAGKTLNNNRPAGLTLTSLTINASTTIVGNRLGISSAIQVANVEAFLDLPIALQGNVQASLVPGARLFMRDRLSPIGAVALETNGYRLTKTGGEMEFNGDITGAGEIRNAGGDVLLTVPVTFPGTVSVQAGARVLFTYYPFRPVVTCGSAPNAQFMLTSAQLSIACVGRIGSLSGTGTLEMFSELSRLFIAGSGTNAVFDGRVTGARPSQIMCCSNGGQTFRGASTYTGAILVDSGALYLDGATFPATSGFTVQGSGGFRAALVGYGSFGETILTAGDLSLSPINDRYGYARFPTLQFAPDVVVDYDISGPTPGVDFTQILMSGQVFLDSALLRLNFRGYTPAVGQSITLIKGATDLLDTFKSFEDGRLLPEGATFMARGPLTDSPGSGGLKFTITYKGGAGHDVIITRLAGPATPTPTATPTATPTPGTATQKRFAPMVARD